MFRDKDKIAQNLQILEWLKAELVDSVGKLLKAMISGSERVILETLSAILITVYLLARRLGISFTSLEAFSQQKILEQIKENNEEEILKEDLKELLDHMKSKKR